MTATLHRFPAPIRLVSSTEAQTAADDLMLATIAGQASNLYRLVADAQAMCAPGGDADRVLIDFGQVLLTQIRKVESGR